MYLISIFLSNKPDRYTESDMKFSWRDPPLSFPGDFGKDGYRLPKYVVSFAAEKQGYFIVYGEGILKYFAG